MKISIRKFEEFDIANKVKWINDSANNQYLHYDLPLEYDKTYQWFINNKDNENRCDMVIEVDDVPVGLIGLLSIDAKASKAEFYIALGEHQYKGRGIAKSASKLMLQYAFKELSLNKVYLFTEVDNTSAQHLFESLGFKKEGRLSQDVMRQGRYYDRYVYGMCKADFYSNLMNIETNITNTPIIKSKLDLGKNNLFIKREDLLPFSFGGNKARKAMYFIRDIEENHADCIVTYGSSSSNHCRIIANLAAANKMPCHIISPYGGQNTYNEKLIRLLGAEVTCCELSDVQNTIETKMKELKEEGFNPYFIMGGGHGKIGTHAYMKCYEEIINYEKQENIKFDYIFHASGTGSTQAGLVCGQILYGHFDKKIVGISIARTLLKGKPVIVESVRDYLGNSAKDLENQIVFVDDYILGGYGKFNKDILKTICKVLETDGIPLDTTYTGKAFYGMEQYILKNEIKNRNILFIHTGGTPLFFDGMELLM